MFFPRYVKTINPRNRSLLASFFMDFEVKKGPNKRRRSKNIPIHRNACTAPYVRWLRRVMDRYITNHLRISYRTGLRKQFAERLDGSSLRTVPYYVQVAVIRDKSWRQQFVCSCNQREQRATSILGDRRKRFLHTTL